MWKSVFFPVFQLMSAIVNRDWTQLVRVCCLDNWREVLAALVTYAGPDEFSSLCGKLTTAISIARYHVLPFPPKNITF